jgi:hypothetical protein
MAEQLEQRQLLSGNVFGISKVPVYVPTSGDINDFKSGPLGNAGALLGQLYVDYKHFVKKGGSKSGFTSKIENSLQTQGTSVAVTVRTRGSMADATTLVHSLGGQLIDRVAVYHALDAWIPISQLSTLAQNSGVANVNPVYRAITSTAGIAPNQGDETLNADSLRSTFDVDGTGIKVGVLSNSVSRFERGLADSQATGDLPSDVTVIQDGDDPMEDDDEGRAMLEEIHDIAPGAQLFFATAEPTQEAFAHNINQLVLAGCQVIVDDVSYFEEPDFQSGIIDQAITDAVVNHNVTYLSSAGNASSAGYTTQGRWVKDVNGRTLLDFDPSDGVSTRMRMTINAAGPITLEWDNPYNGIVGSATSDLDISFIDPNSGQIIMHTEDANLATGTPVDFIPANSVIPGIYDVQISVSDLAPGAALPTLVRFRSGQSGGSTPPFSDFQFPGMETSTFGHNAGQSTISVGAVPFFNAPPFSSTTPIESEPFSSFGPVISVFTANGERRNKPITLLKPDLSGIDGVDTSFFGDRTANDKDKDKLSNFFGTSAAAPNVAAVAALLLEVKPDATSTDIKNALLESAKQNPLNGSKAGTFDPQGGFGLVNALTAAQALEPNFIVADIGHEIGNSMTKGIDSITINFTEPVTGFDIKDLDLTRGPSGTVDLLNGSGAKLVTNDNEHFILKGLKNITSHRGTYTLAFHPNGVLDAATGTRPALQGSTSFFVSGKPTGFIAIPTSGSEIDLSWIDNSPGDSGFIITRTTDPNFVNNVVTFKVGAGVTHFRDTGLTPTTQYFYRIRTNVNDGAPNPPTDVINAFTLAGNEVIADNRSSSTVIDGNWTGVASSDAYAGDYLETPATGNKSVTFNPHLDDAGSYFIYVRAIAGSGNATNTPVDLLINGEVKKSFLVNQRSSTGWVLVGQFNLAKGNSTSVQIRNNGANGRVIADAVRFQRTATA